MTGYIVKIVAGFAMLWVYSDYYTKIQTNDVYKYYNDSQPIYETLKSDPVVFSKIFFLGIEDEETLPTLEKTNNWYRSINSLPTNNNRLMIRVNTVFRMFSLGGNIWVHTLFVCWLMMIAAIWIFRFFEAYTPHKNILFLIICGLPSVAFWSSPVMKESLTIMGLAAIIYSLYLFKRQHKIRIGVLLLFLGCILLIFIKIYILLFLIPGLIIYFTTKIRLSFWVRTSLLYILLIGGLFVSDGLNKNKLAVSITEQRDNFSNLAEGGVYFIANDSIFYAHDDQRNHLEIIDNKVKVISTFKSLKRPIENSKDTSRSMVKEGDETYVIYFNQKRSGSYLPIPEIQPTTFSLIKNAPIALANGLFRPYPTEVDNATTLLAFLENIFILFLLILCCFFYKKSTAIKPEVTHLFIAFSVMLIILVGLTTPVSGAIVRYRMPAFLFIAILAVIHIDFERIANRFSFLKKK